MASSILLSDNGVSSGSAGIKTSGGSDGVLLLQTTTSGGTATTAVTVDTAQNVGVGVTPSAWGGPFKAIQSGNGGSAVGFQTNANVMRLFVNNFYNGTNYVYTGSAAASQYTCNSDGSFNWQIAASGTAGNAISFTQAMTLDASGNLGVGLTSISEKLDVYQAARISFAGNSEYRVRITDTDGNGRILVDGNATALIFGTSSAGAGNTATERARIDSSGNLLVGITSAGGNGGISITPSAASPQVQVNGSSTSSGAGFTIYSNGAGANRFYVTYAGQINATSTSITAISDQSLKENIRDLDTGLTQVMALRPRRFDWKEETQIGLINVAGFIAQEVEQVLPELVYDYQYNDEQTKKSLKMGDILPTLVKAIQEQQAIIQTLTQRVEALEGAK